MSTGSVQVKPKKKRSFWFLRLLLILIVFAGGVILGLKLYGMPGPSTLLDRYFPTLQSTLNPASAAKESTATPAPTAETQPAEAAPAAAESEEPAAASAEPPAAEVPAEPEPAASESVIGGTDGPTGIYVSAPAEEAAQPIGIDAALAAALKRAGVEEKDAEVYGVYPTESSGLAVYQVDFAADGAEYMYLVDLFSGEIAGFKTVRANQSYSGQVPTDVFDGMVPDDLAGKEDFIGAEEAEKTAVSHAGFKGSAVTELQSELKREGSSVWYEVSFKAGGYSYTCRVNAADGEILKYDKVKA